MLATDFKLIPLAALSKHEAAVRRDLDALPISYEKNLLDEPETRYAFLYYALLTHWPELLNGGTSAEELLYNRLYWFLRMSKRYRVDHDFEGGFERQAAALFESASRELGVDVVQEIEVQVAAEMGSNEWEIAVAFSEFSIKKIKKQFGIQLDESDDFFANVAPISVNSALPEFLKDSLPLALKIGTEKARSEMIVTPVLLEVYRRLGRAISFFSGTDWNVDEAQGLSGRCDFLMGLTSEQLMIESPVLTIVEVKNDDTHAGIAQCLAEMIAAQIFNRQNQSEIPTIYGVVTTGSIWKFLRLVEKTAYIDVSEYHIKEVERIVGIIVSMFTRSGVPMKA
jgi:hypothetical protein